MIKNKYTNFSPILLGCIQRKIWKVRAISRDDIEGGLKQNKEGARYSCNNQHIKNINIPLHSWKVLGVVGLSIKNTNVDGKMCTAKIGSSVLCHLLVTMSTVSSGNSKQLCNQHFLNGQQLKSLGSNSL